MINLVSLLGGALTTGPKWFSGIDCIFEFVAIIVTLLISAYIFRLYRFSKQEKYFWLGLSFLAIAFAFIGKVFTNSFFYNQILERYAPIVSGLTLGIVEDVGLLYIVGHLGFRFLMLAGLLGIYFVIESSQEKGKFSEIINKKHLILFLYLIAGLVLLSTYKYLIFYITASLILCFIAFVLIRNHIEVRSNKTLLIALAFLVLLVSQMIFIFIVLSNYAYVVGQVVQLIGFGLLLAAYYKLAR